jgi:hypothetical protein
MAWASLFFFVVVVGFKPVTWAMPLVLSALVSLQVGSWGFFCLGLASDLQPPTYGVLWTWDHHDKLIGWDGNLANILPWLAWTAILLISASWVSWYYRCEAPCLAEVPQILSSLVNFYKTKFLFFFYIHRIRVSSSITVTSATSAQEFSNSTLKHKTKLFKFKSITLN